MHGLDNQGAILVRATLAYRGAIFHTPVGDVVKRFASDGSTPVGTRPEEFDAHIKSEIAKWQKLVKDAGLKLH